MISPLGTSVDSGKGETGSKGVPKKEELKSSSFLVPGAGLEPARLLRTQDFESSASTNSATRAFCGTPVSSPGLSHEGNPELPGYRRAAKVRKRANIQKMEGKC